MIKRSGHRTDLELLVNDAILLGKPVDAVVALAHPADGAADSVGGEASGHAAGGLVHRGEVDLENKGDRSEGAVCQKKSIATRNLKSKIERSLKA